MRKYRIELERYGNVHPAERWRSTLEVNHGSDDETEWWGDTSIPGTLLHVLFRSHLRIRDLEEMEDQDA